MKDKKPARQNIRFYPASTLIRWWRKGDISNRELKSLVKHDYLKKRLNKREKERLGL